MLLLFFVVLVGRFKQSLLVGYLKPALLRWSTQLQVCVLGLAASKNGASKLCLMSPSFILRLHLRFPNVMAFPTSSSTQVWGLDPCVMQVPIRWSFNNVHVRLSHFEAGKLAWDKNLVSARIRPKIYHCEDQHRDQAQWSDQLRWAAVVDVGLAGRDGSRSEATSTIPCEPPISNSLVRSNPAEMSTLSGKRSRMPWTFDRGACDPG